MSKFVLIPGAWLGGWVWKKVAHSLMSRGHEAYPVTLTGMGDRSHLLNRDYGMETAIKDVTNLIEFEQLEDVILIGHSFAGKVAAAVADRIPGRIKLLVYLDALFPGKTRDPQAGFDPTEEFGEPPKGSIAIPLTEKIVDKIGSDVLGQDREWLLSKATPWPIKTATDPIVLSERFDSVKCAYIFCTGTGDPVDEILEGKWGALYGETRVMDSGHWPMITQPDILAEKLLSLL